MKKSFLVCLPLIRLLIGKKMKAIVSFRAVHYEKVFLFSYCDFLNWIYRFAVSEGDHEKISKKELLLLGRRKEKKDKKDRGYATLDGESSPEEDFETK